MTEPFRTAIIYDFDGTLAKGNLQETSFIPSIGMNKSEFWSLVKEKTKKEDADEILVYMQLMLEKAKEKDLDITKAELSAHGKQASLFPGLEDGSWFKRINRHGQDRNLEIEHYVVSSGVFEMINGCSIWQYFKKVYASKYIYKDGNAAWPGLAINYTTKTQYLFRINKGIDNCWDNKALNQFTPEKERPIPFSRMIFVGDGDTDIPTMKMLTHQGGYSIAVYNPEADQKEIGKTHSLISDGRVTFVAPADYCEHSGLDIVVKGILGRIAREFGYRPENSPEGL